MKRGDLKRSESALSGYCIPGSYESAGTSGPRSNPIDSKCLLKCKIVKVAKLSNPSTRRSCKLSRWTLSDFVNFLFGSVGSSVDYPNKHRKICIELDPLVGFATIEIKNRENTP